MDEAFESPNYWAKGNLENVHRRVAIKQIHCSGFSFVYLAQDDMKQPFAIKTIRCKMGKEVAQNAIKEAIITDRFQHKNIIKIEVRARKLIPLHSP